MAAAASCLIIQHRAMLTRLYVDALLAGKGAERYALKTVDLHAELTHLLQPGNNPHQATRIAVFSNI